MRTISSPASKREGTWNQAQAAPSHRIKMNLFSRCICPLREAWDQKGRRAALVLTSELFVFVARISVHARVVVGVDGVNTVHPTHISLVVEVRGGEFLHDRA